MLIQWQPKFDHLQQKAVFVRKLNEGLSLSTKIFIVIADNSDRSTINWNGSFKIIGFSGFNALQTTAQNRMQVLVKNPYKVGLVNARLQGRITMERLIQASAHLRQQLRMVVLVKYPSKVGECQVARQNYKGTLTSNSSHSEKNDERSILMVVTTFYRLPARAHVQIVPWGIQKSPPV